MVTALTGTGHKQITKQAPEYKPNVATICKKNGYKQTTETSKK